MPGASRAEFYFISAMMFLIIVLCVGAVYIFFKTYKKEMRDRAEREASKTRTAEVAPTATSISEPAKEA